MNTAFVKEKGVLEDWFGVFNALDNSLWNGPSRRRVLSGLQYVHCLSGSLETSSKLLKVDSNVKPSSAQ